MANTPWLNSDDIISSIKRKISLPISQNLFSETDLLAFVNEEMMVSQVPAVLQFHEEYFVYKEEIELQDNKSNYPIPNRAIGMRLRDVMWKDESGNLFEMTRIDASDKAFYQSNVGANTAIHKFYLENNDVVLTPSLRANLTGTLVMYFFLRPNVLVETDRAATVVSFHKTITVVNASLSDGDVFFIDDVQFTAVSGSPSTNEFQIGGTSTITATNLSAAINTNGVMSSTSSGAVITVTYTDVTQTITSEDAGIVVQEGITVEFDAVPDNIIAGSVIDFLQTKPGHKILSYNVTVPSASISGNNISFDEGDVPSDIIVGDYICSEYECIIPQLPTDLHSGLVERACARILAAMGDQAGLAAANQKIGENSLREGTMLDARVEGAPKKVNARHSLLRYTKMGTKRRF